MCEEIRDFISRCNRCQRKKLLKIQKTHTQLRNVPVPKKIFGQIAIDLLQMSESEGFTYVLGVQCFFTKWMEMVPIPDKKGTTIAKQLYIIFTLYGCPDVIVSDRGTEFCNQLNEALFYYMGVEHRLTAPYHPEANGMSFEKKNKTTNVFTSSHRIFIYTLFPILYSTLFLFTGMIERLNRTMTQCLRACINQQKDWIVVLQSITMSYRSTRHDSTGKSPYEMMFGCPMRLPFELKTNPFTGIPQHINNDHLGDILPESTSEEIAEKFSAIDKIRNVIHNAASDEIARSQLKQAKYYDSRHCGSKLHVGDKVLHFNRKAAQRQGDKTAPRWLGPYTIVKVHDKGNYTVKDKNGHQLATKVCASNLKLWQEPIASDYLPDWMKPSLVPDTVSDVKEDLDKTEKEKLLKRKRAQVKKAKPNQYLQKLYGDNLPPPPCDRQDPVEHITPNVFKDEPQESPDKSLNKKKVHFADNISVHTFPTNENDREIPSETSVPSSPPKSVSRHGLRPKLKRTCKNTSPPSLQENSQNIDNDIAQNLRQKKNEFFSSMLSVCDEIGTQSENDVQVLGSVHTNDFIFNPLTVPVRKAICQRLDMPFQKADLKHENIGEKLFDRNPKVKTILGDGNCLFRGLAVAITGWETAHLAFRQLICEHISEVGTYMNIDPHKYLKDSKMKSLKIYGTDVEIMAAAQIIGCDIYVYHTYGKSLKWL